jgi:hypothetical protein
MSAHADNWRDLLVRYADGRQLCNCSRAYYTVCPGGERRTCAGCWTPGDQPHTYCEGGCSSNQISARDYIAARIVAELNAKDEPS